MVSYWDKESGTARSICFDHVSHGSYCEAIKNCFTTSKDDDEDKIVGWTVSLFNYIHMLDIHFIRANVDMVKAAVQNKKLTQRTKKRSKKLP